MAAITDPDCAPKARVPGPEQQGSLAAARPASKIGITITAMLAMIAMIMSSTMVNVAIPDIMGAFGVGLDQAHWISSGFLSAMTGGMLLNAWLTINFGPRNVFIGALALFSVTAFMGQYAPTYDGLVLARIAQGFCAGLIQPLAMSTVFLAYPPQERGTAMGWLGMGIVFGPTIGPVLGGVIIDAAHWRLVFAAPVPIMFIAAGMAAIYMPGREVRAEKIRFNLLNFSLMIAALMLLLNGITTGQREGWGSDPVFYLMFGAASAFILFLVREWHSDAPLLNLKLFRYRYYVASAAVSFIFGAGMFGSLYIVPVMVQTVQGLTALAAGLMLLPGGIVSMLAFPIAGRMATWGNPVHAITLGLGAFAISCWLLAGTGMLTAFWWMALVVAFGRIGLGIVVPSLNLGAMAAVPRALVPHAAGTLNFIRMAGAALGVTILATLIDSDMARYEADLAVMHTADNPVSQEIVTRVAGQLTQTGIPEADRLAAADGYLDSMLHLKASELAFQNGYLALAILFALGMIVTLLAMRTRQPGGVEGGVEGGASKGAG